VKVGFSMMSPTTAPVEGVKVRFPDEPGVMEETNGPVSQVGQAMLGVVPPEEVIGPEAVTAVTVPPPPPPPGILAMTLIPPDAFKVTVGVPVVRVPSALTEAMLPQLKM
jgi:hypothetical protein